MLQLPKSHKEEKTMYSTYTTEQAIRQLCPIVTTGQKDLK